MAERGLLQGSDDRGPCVRRRLPGMREGGCMTHIRNLAGGLEPLREWFNDKSAYARIVAIQSPT
jgi:hypothetical protein